LRKVAISFVIYVSVRPSAWNNSAPTGRVFIKFDLYFSKLEKMGVSLISDNITDVLHEDVRALLIIPRGIPRMRNVSVESYR